MYCVQEFCFLLCTIPIITATAIKIDGLINFGKNWNYEYHVYKMQENALRTQNNDPVDQMQKVKDLVRIAQERLRNVSSELRQDEPQEDSMGQSSLDTDDPAIRSINKPKDVGNIRFPNLSEYSGDSSSSESDSYNDSDYIVSDLEKDTNVVDIETTRAPKKNILRLKDSDYSHFNKTVKKDHKTKLIKKNDEDQSAIDSLLYVLDYSIQNTNPKTQRKQFETDLPHTTTKIVTDFFYNKTFVDQYKNITEFNHYVLNATKHIFGIVKQKTDQDHIKTLIDQLERIYKAKFNKFLQETAKQKIKTRLGTQKVILNSIATSTGFLNRLSNFLFDGMSLTHNAETAKTFKKMVETLEIVLLVHACETFGICRSKSLFSVFLFNVLETILSYDDRKFKETIDAIAEELKYTNFSALEPKAQQKLKSTIDTIEKVDLQHAKVVVAILKNTIANINKPMAMNPSMPHIVNSTLVLFEIIDLLNTNIVNNYYNNTSKWATIEDSFKEFGVGKIDHIQSIISSFVNYVKENINILDQASREILVKNFVTVLNHLK